MTKAPRGPLGVWLGGIRVGIETLAREPALGLKRLALPVSYWRAAEFAYVCRQMMLPAGARVIDLGSPKDLAAILARYCGYQVTATDILPEAIALSERYATAQRLGGDGPGRVRSEIQDGRALTYDDDTFDAAYSVSVLEHIPDKGDSLAIQELIRVVKPGGLVVFTVPFDLSYRETFVDRPVYERAQRDGEPVFLERHYDTRTLAERLTRQSRAEVADVRLVGEGRIRMERLLNQLGGAAILLSPFEAFLSRAFLRELPQGANGHPMAAFCTLKVL